MTARRTAKELANILTEHLSALPKKEVKERIKEGKKVLKKKTATSSCGFSASDNHPTASRTSKGVSWAARGR